MAEAAGEIHFRTILLWHSQGRGKEDPKHKCCWNKQNLRERGVEGNLLKKEKF